MLDTKQCVTVVAFAAVLALSGCATHKVFTGRVQPISGKFLKHEFRFTELARAELDFPYARIRVQRRRIHRVISRREVRMERRLSASGWIANVTLSGALIVAGNYGYRSGKVVLGRDLMGIGTLLTPVAYVLAHRNGKGVWEKRDDQVAGKWEPYANGPVVVTLEDGGGAEAVRTDDRGELLLPAATFVGLARAGRDVVLKLGIPEQPDAKGEVVFSAHLMNAFGTNPELLLGKAGKPKLPPYPVAKLEMTPPSGMVPAGRTLTLRLTVENRGKGSVYRLLGTISSEAAFLEGAKFYLGMIPPGGRVSSLVRIAVPLKCEGGDVPFTINFSEENDYVPDPVHASLYVEPAPRPRLTYSYQLIDDNTGNSVGNGDGRIQKGEAIDLLLTVKNIGSASAKRVMARIWVPNIDGIEVNVPAAEVGDLAPGENRSIRLTFTAKKTVDVDQVPLKLNLTERSWELDVVHQLTFPLEEAIAPQILALRREVVVSVPEADVRGGADPTAPVIGKVPEGGALLATGQLNDWFRVELPGGLKGWVRKDQVEVKRQQVSDQEAMQVVSSSKTRVIRVFEQMPPSIAVFSPEEDHVVQAASAIEVAGLITDDKGVTRYEIRVNGRAVGGQKAGRGLAVVPNATTGRPAAERSVRFQETVPLQEGTNVVTIMAYDADGLSARKEIVVERTKKLPEIWAVVVGISRYKNARQLRFADRDARAFYNYLVDHLGVPKDHVSLYLNEQATLSNVKRALGDELRRRAGSEDQVVIYFAGHGAVENDPSSPDGDGLSKYLVMYDTKPDALYSTALPMEEVARIFGRLASDRVVWIGDTCYSGGSGGRTIFTGSRRAGLSEQFLDRLSRGKGRVILTACRANEVSLEDPKLGHGVFTYSLLRALQGKADADHDGFVTVDEAYAYLSKLVPELTGQVQHPIKKGEVEGDIVLGRK